MDTKNEKSPSEQSDLPLEEQLRKYINQSDFSQQKLGKDADVPASTISRFMSSKGGGLQFSSAAKLAQVLRLKLVPQQDEIVCHPTRSEGDSDILIAELAKAKKVICILTSHPGRRIQTYVGAIMEAVERDRDDRKKGDKAEDDRLRVRVLASDPKNPCLAWRARQLGATAAEYERDLEKLLRVIATEFEAESGTDKGPTCQLKVYTGLPIQLWTLIDDYLYLHTPSLKARSRDNCMFKVPVHLPGVKETYLDHFEALWDEAREFPGRVSRAR
jgi:transcriptional regulator with XRE-family HTH domain